jgi:hypothetical protein
MRWWNRPRVSTRQPQFCQLLLCKKKSDDFFLGLCFLWWLWVTVIASFVPCLRISISRVIDCLMGQEQVFDFQHYVSHESSEHRKQEIKWKQLLLLWQSRSDNLWQTSLTEHVGMFIYLSCMLRINMLTIMIILKISCLPKSSQADIAQYHTLGG